MNNVIKKVQYAVPVAKGAVVAILFLAILFSVACGSAAYVCP